MPQLDKYIFVDHALLVFVSFFLVYFINNNYILPQIVGVLKFRNKYVYCIDKSLFMWHFLYVHKLVSGFRKFILILVLQTLHFMNSDIFFEALLAKLLKSFSDCKLVSKNSSSTHLQFIKLFRYNPLKNG
jgi:hypothetical protein